MTSHDRVVRPPLRLFLAALAVAVVVLAVARLSGPSEPPPADPGGPGRLPRPSSCGAAAGGAKPPLQGVVTIGGLPGGAVGGHVGGTSISVPWADLQPERGGPLVRPNAVDEAVQAVRTAAVEGRCPLGVKVRVLAGASSPGWAKTLDGPPLELVLPLDGLQGTVPRFWTPSFGRAYDDLQRLLADAYDGVAEVREVAMTRCTTFYGEPLLRQATVPANAAALAGAGLDTGSDRRCLQEQNAGHRVWERTPSTLALNPYVDVAPGGTGAGSTDLPVAAAEDCRRVLGSRCVLSNNSLRVPVPPGPYTALYEAMARLGPPLEFQTAGPRRVGDLVGAVQYAVDARAGSVETEVSSEQRYRPALAELSDRTGWGPR